MPSVSPYADIDEAQELLNSRTGVAFGKNGNRPLERNWLVKTTNKYYGPNEICSATGVAEPYEQYVTPEGVDFDTNACCLELSARLVPQAEDDNRHWWIVTAKYGTDVPPEGIPTITNLGNYDTGSQTLPWEEPILIRYDSEVIQDCPPYSMDIENGKLKPFVNSALQPFTPPYTQEEGRRILVVTRNQQTFDFDLGDEYSFAVNSDNFVPPGSTVGVSPGAAQCFPIHAEMASRGIIPFWRVTYRIRIGRWILDPDNPQTGAYVREKFSPVRILDAGLCRLQESALFPGFEQPVPIMGPFGRITQPDLLDGAGQPVEMSGGTRDPVYLSFTTRRSMPFQAIITTGIG